MDATAPSLSPLSSRPRVTPGVPAGGVAAVLVTVAAMSWGLMAGGTGDEPQPRMAAHAPLPPLPPMPPMAPQAPRAPGDLAVEAEMVRRQVEEALRGLDVEAIRAEALAAAAEARSEAVRALAEARAEARAEAHAGMGALSDGTFKASFVAPRGVRVVDMTGDVAIEVSRKADSIQVEADGAVGAHAPRVVDGVLTLVGGSGSLRLVVPRDADLAFANLTGDVAISGRSDGALTAEIQRGNLAVERVGRANIVVHQAGDVALGRVDDALAYASHGAGNLVVERAGSAALNLMGRSTVAVERVNDALTLAIPGHSDVTVGRVEGPVRADFSGAGTVAIDRGEAKPLQVTVTGAGEFRFNGTAHDPVVLASGMGSVHVAKHTGRARVQNTGQGKTWVGE